MGGMGSRLSLERKHLRRNSVELLLSVFAILLPRCLTHHKKKLSTECLYGILHFLVNTSRSFTGGKFLYNGYSIGVGAREVEE